jgi:hypothetical protein
MRCLKVKTGVFRRTTILVQKLCTKVFGYLVVIRLVVSGCQTFSKLFSSWREAVISLVAASPELVTIS